MATTVKQAFHDRRRMRVLRLEVRRKAHHYLRRDLTKAELMRFERLCLAAGVTWTWGMLEMQNAYGMDAMGLLCRWIDAGCPQDEGAELVLMAYRSETMLREKPPWWGGRRYRLVQAEAGPEHGALSATK